MSEELKETQAAAMNRVLRPEPDGGEYNVDVTFLDGSSEALCYSTEVLARQAFQAIKSNPFFRVRFVSLSKHLDWCFPGHGRTP